ncbi:trypsin-like peptidase domain-containing protein [Pontibacter sp. HJ8]
MVLLIALFSAALAIAGYRYIDQRTSSASPDGKPLSLFNNSSAAVTSTGQPDLVQAAARVTPAVVHIRTLYEVSAAANRNPIYDLYGVPQDPAPARGAGSGVLITADGYIVTNNHVIENTSEIEVTLTDKRSFTAKLIGRDPGTDLALLKVEGKDLPVVPNGNSDSVRVGEWVLAVGYPLSLNSTVTAGIISAKGRSIGILNRPSQDSYGNPAQAGANTAIESFIQTDAAINPGNSGGALVNANGQLIGINAAIASMTGSYSGYGFAIPVNLMQKVVSDLRKFGEVRRGYLGVSFPAPAVEDQMLEARGIDPANVKGVYVLAVQPGGGAAEAGLKEGDIIQSIDGVRVISSAELSERVARHHPGDKIELSYLRDGRTRKASVTLKGETAEKEVAGSGLEARLGAAFAPLPDQVKERYGLRAGLYVTEVQRGGFFDSAGIPRGSIITRVNGNPVGSLSDLNKVLGASRSGSVRLEGILPDGTRFVFSFPLGA